MSEFLAFLDIQLKEQVFAVQILVAEAMFAIWLERRSRFVLRLVGGLIAYFILCLLVPPLLFALRKELNYFVIFLLSAGIFPLCFKEKPFDLLFCVVAALLVQNLSSNLGVLACNIFRIDPDVDVNLSSAYLQVPVYLAAHAVSYFVWARKLRGKQDFGAEKRLTLILLAASMESVFILCNILVDDGLEFYGVPRVMFVIYNILALSFLFGASAFKSLQKENEELEELIRRQDEMKEYNRRAVEIINLKSHDLKHYLSAIKSGERVSDEHIRETEDAIRYYEAAAKTENSVLNTILTEKMILCGQYNIKFSHIVDEHGLERLSAIDLSALFNNILENAIQYLLTVEEEKRLMSLTILSRQGFCAIHCENYCKTAPEMSDGLPVTTKADKDFHGFGLKSVRYIVQKYGGHMTVEAHDQLFLVDIILPL